MDIESNQNNHYNYSSDEEELQNNENNAKLNYDTHHSLLIKETNDFEIDSGYNTDKLSKILPENNIDNNESENNSFNNENNNKNDNENNELNEQNNKYIEPEDKMNIDIIDEDSSWIKKEKKYNFENNISILKDENAIHDYLNLSTDMIELSKNESSIMDKGKIK